MAETPSKLLALALRWKGSSGGVPIGVGLGMEDTVTAATTTITTDSLIATITRKKLSIIHSVDLSLFC